MMFQSHLPLNLWVEAFATASYISNLLPSSALDNKSPFEMLFKEKPSYRSLRVFGSACYPCLRPLQDHKFDPKSLQCVFVGYSSLHKGYMCLYPPTGKVYITRHALFDEEIFPFKDQYKHLLPQYDTPLLNTGQQATRPEPVVREEPQITRLLSTPQAQEDQVVLENPQDNHNNDNVVIQEEEQEAVPVDPQEPVPNIHPMQTELKTVGEDEASFELGPPLLPSWAELFLHLL